MNTETMKIRICLARENAFLRFLRAHATEAMKCHAREEQVKTRMRRKEKSHVTCPNAVGAVSLQCSLPLILQHPQVPETSKAADVPEIDLALSL